MKPEKDKAIYKENVCVMKNGLSRFTFYIQKIKMLLTQAGKEKNPAMWLFSNDARTPFFMLEGLARIYAGMHNTKKFGKLKEHFKLIEDGLGQIDYYQWLSEAFISKKQIPEGYRQYAEEQLEQRVKQMNELLIDEGWMSGNSKRLKKITKKLDEIDWLKSDKEVEAIADFYKKSVAAINRFVTGTDYHFNNIEEDVHELRRKLRWLSIYAQALQGVVQYAPDIKAAAHLKKYLTEEIITSPYNKLPAADNNTSFLLVRKNYFLALSWVIEELGNIKDEGLLLTGLCEAIKQSSSCSEEEALAKAYTLLGGKQRKMQIILHDAEVITRTFFKERNLQYLVAKTTVSR